jgi:hypothetical protein
MLFDFKKCWRYSHYFLAVLLLLIFCQVVRADQPAPLLINSEGWYPQFANVDANGPDFQAMLAWVRTKSRVGLPPVLRADPLVGSTRLAPYVLHYSCSSGSSVDVDAVYTFYRPDISVIDIERACGLPITNPGPYTQPRPPPDSPPVQAAKPTILVGAAIDPVNYPGWYQGVPFDDSPNGFSWKDNRDGSTYVKFITAGPFGNSVRWYKVE